MIEIGEETESRGVTFVSPPSKWRFPHQRRQLERGLLF